MKQRSSGKELFRCYSLWIMCSCGYRAGQSMRNATSEGGGANCKTMSCIITFISLYPKPYVPCSFCQQDILLSPFVFRILNPYFSLPVPGLLCNSSEDNLPFCQPLIYLLVVNLFVSKY